MRDRQSLPDASLTPVNSVSAAFLSAGARTYREAARLVYRLPYGRTSARDNPIAVLTEGRGTCSWARPSRIRTGLNHPHMSLAGAAEPSGSFQLANKSCPRWPHRAAGTLARRRETGTPAALLAEGELMYFPKSDQITDIATLNHFINDYSFATIISLAEGRIFGSRVPMLLDPSRGKTGTLIGHLARANPQWHSFDGRVEAMVVFDGPHTYISPNWYVTTPAVPTWNYATVHAYGRARAI
jgi:hypothetical protein